MPNNPFKNLTTELKLLWQRIRLFADRFTPKTLMLRYSLALLALAGLIALEQFVVQLTLQRQAEGQRLMRQADRQNLEATRLAKAALAVELAGRDSDLTNQASSFAETVFDFENGHQALIASLNLYRDGWLGSAIVDEQTQLDSAFRQLRLEQKKRWKKRTKSSSTRQLRYALREDMPKLRSAIAEYRESMERALLSLDDVNLKQVRTARNLEACLFILLLGVLLLEGFFIFRPSIRGLEGALQVRSDFMSRMSHEIRNPMNAIMGMTDVMRETPLSDLQKQYLNTLDRSSQTLLELLNSLLDFSELENGKTKVEKVRFNLIHVLNKAVDISAVRAHEKNVEIVLDIDPMTPINVSGDPTRLHQVVCNLLSNAVKFTERGEVRLTVKPELTSSAEQYVCFGVVDTGIGISPNAMSRIFDSFVQAESSTRRKYGGTGLGLTISKDLVRLMGGQLKVDSEQGVGSRFHFALPVGLAADNTLTLKYCLSQHDLKDAVVLILGRTSPTLKQAAETVRMCGGRVETSIESVDLTDPHSLVLVAPQDDESIFQFFPESFPAHTRIVCLIPTVVPPAKMRSYLSYGISEFVLAPFKPLDFVEIVVRGRKPVAVNATSLEVLETTPQFKILVADDSPDNRDMIRLYLSREKVKIDYAVTGAQALQKFQTDHYDLVLMDIQMPVLDGTEAFFSIREWEIVNELKPTPIIAVTADDRPEQKTALLQLGFASLLMKPFRKRELLNLVHKWKSAMDVPNKASDNSEMNKIRTEADLLGTEGTPSNQ